MVAKDRRGEGMENLRRAGQAQRKPAAERNAALRRQILLNNTFPMRNFAPA